MTRDESRRVADQINSRWREILDGWTGPAKTPVNHEISYVCPICGHGKNGDGITEWKQASKPGVLKCFGCGFGGDIIALWRECNPGCGFYDALDSLARIAGVILPEDDDQGKGKGARMETRIRPVNIAPAAAGLGKTQQESRKTEAQPGKFLDDIRKAAMEVYKAADYLHSRGLEDWIINSYQIGYKDDQKFFTQERTAQGEKKTVVVNRPAIIIPYDAQGNYYIARSLEGKMFYKPPEKDAGPEPVYNLAALYSGGPCFVCESQLDAVSIAQAQGMAVALGGGGKSAFFRALERRKPEQPLILCFDNDEAGRKNTQEVASELGRRNIPFITSRFLRDTKDANEYLQKYGSEDLAAEVRRHMKTARRKMPFTPYRVGEYLASGFDEDIDYFRKYRHRKTGFSNLDKFVTLYPGLAALGGASSVGKTSFCVALADNLARAGETILYFALEQEPIELVTKLLARRLYDADPTTRLTNLDIKEGATSPKLEEIKGEYGDEADRFIVVRCNFNTTSEDIRGYVENFIETTGTRPVCVIDYVQLVAPPEDFRGDSRAAIDHSIKEIKDMQRGNELLVILISSFNRSSYNTTVGFADFKESGLLEYTCDYVWALQLAVLDKEEYYRTGRKDADAKKKSDLLREAMTEDPKKVEFVSLKSRNGRQAYKCQFDYHMKHDTFYPAEEDNGDYQSIRNDDPLSDGWDDMEMF